MKRYFTLIILLGTLWFTACEKPPLSAPVDSDPKTFIMFGDIYTFSGNISGAGAAVAAGALIEGQQVVYYRYNSTGGALYRLVKSKSEPGYESKLIKNYDDGISGFDTDKFRTIIKDARSAAPANHYALAIGSHGRGWVPYSSWNTRSQRAFSFDNFAPFFEMPENPTTRFIFGDAMSRRMEVSELALSLDGLHFDFILLDQCLMGGIEVAYELKDIASYLILSPAEILIGGFPFQKIITRIFKNWSDLSGVCRDFVEYYENSYNPYATISLIKTSELPALAQAVRAIAAESGKPLTPPTGVAGLQYYEALSTHLFYDFGQYIEKSTANAELYSQFEQALNRAIPHKGYTANFFSGLTSEGAVIPISYYSGLSAYVPDGSTLAFLPFYQQTLWYKAVYGD